MVDGVVPYHLITAYCYCLYSGAFFPAPPRPRPGPRTQERRAWATGGRALGTALLLLLLLVLSATATALCLGHEALALLLLPGCRLQCARYKRCGRAAHKRLFDAEVLQVFL
jgi:hypothetical protein